MMRPHTLTTTFAAGLVAFALLLPSPLNGSTPAHAQAPAAGLAARDRAAFASVLPGVQRCSTDLSTVTSALQTASDNLSAGDTDMGSLRSDAVQMRNDCLSAAHRVDRLRFAAGDAHATARRLRNELHAALVDYAQGAYDCMRLVDDLSAGDNSAATLAMRQGVSAWDAAAAHLHVATRYLH